MTFQKPPVPSDAIDIVGFATTHPVLAAFLALFTVVFAAKVLTQ